MVLIQFGTFATVGALGTLLHFSILVVSVQLLGYTPVAGTFVGATAGAAFNYYFNHRVTFRSDSRHREAAPKFAVSAGLSITLNTGFVALLTGFGLHYLIAQVLATTGALILNFAISKLWVFRR